MYSCISWNGNIKVTLEIMMKLKEIDNKTFLVFGFGKTGCATANFLQNNDAKVFVWDDDESKRHYAMQAGYKVTDPVSINFQTLKALVLAPGIPLNHSIVEKARLYGVDIINDIDFLFKANPDATFIGVTGTNGKSTTTALITHIIKEAGFNVQIGGNFGIPALSLDPMGDGDICVLELSSYQLDLIKENQIKIAVILNITPDHISHHGNMANYISAKTNIIQTDKQQSLIIGTDEKEAKEILESVKNTCPNLNITEISSNDHVKNGIKISKNKFKLIEDNKVIDLSFCKTLKGLHNTQNAAAAFAVCKTLNISTKQIEKSLRSFSGLNHRQQLVATLNGVQFINDSKATNANATAKALITYNNIYWIIGGRAKETGLDGLEELLDNVKHAFIVGECEDEFAKWCEGKISFTRCKTLDKAVTKSANMAFENKISNSSVLLSPACASFDQFDSFEHRGETFVQLVHSL